MAWKTVFYGITIPVILILLLMGFAVGVLWIPVLIGIVLLAIPYALGYWKDRSIAANTGKHMPSGSSARDALGGNDVPDRRDE